MIDNTVVEDINERKFLCTIYTTLSRNENTENHTNGNLIIEAFDYKIFFNMNGLYFNLENINQYFNNSFHITYKMYIDELMLLEYVPKYINAYTLVASVYIKPKKINHYILNQHILNTLERNVICDDINQMGQQYSILNGSSFNELSLLSHFIKQIDGTKYNKINQHNYLNNPIMPYVALDTHLRLNNYNLLYMFEILMIIERNICIDKFSSYDGDNLINNKINEVNFYGKTIDIVRDGYFKLNNNTIYNKLNDTYIIIHETYPNDDYVMGITDIFMRRIFIKKNILIVEDSLFYYILSTINHLKDRFVIINYKDWVKLSTCSKLDLIMTCIDDITPVVDKANVNTVDYGKFASDLSTHVCCVINNNNNIMDITKIANMSSNLSNIKPNSTFYGIYNGYLSDSNNKETDVMMLDFISCGNYFPTFNHISKNSNLKSHFNKKQHKHKHECCICLENKYLNQMIITRCGHKFCKNDMIEIFNEAMNNLESDQRFYKINCPLCRETLEDKDIYNLSKNDKLCNYIKKNLIDHKTKELVDKLKELGRKNPDTPELHIIIGNTNRWLNSITNLIRTMKFSKNIVIKPLTWKSKFDFNMVDDIKSKCFNDIKYSKVEYHIMNSSYRGEFFEHNYYKNLTNTIYFFNNVYGNFMEIINDYNYINCINKLTTIMNAKKEILIDMISKSEKLDVLFNFYVIKNTIDEKIFKKEIQFINHFKQSNTLINNNNIPIITYS